MDAHHWLREGCLRTFQQGRRLLAPLLGYPGLQVLDKTMAEARQHYQWHYRALHQLIKDYAPDIIFPFMDLSLEAEALGLETAAPPDDVPTVPEKSYGRKNIRTLSQKNILLNHRIQNHLSTIEALKDNHGDNLHIGGYLTGPYTLAGLILGAENAAMQSLLNPFELHETIQAVMPALFAYANAQTEAGADLIMILEPSAALLGPEPFRQFSVAYLNKLSNRIQQSGAASVVHICGDIMAIFDAMLEIRCEGFSLDAPQAGVRWDKILEQCPQEYVLFGNVSPTEVLLSGSPEKVENHTKAALEQTAGRPTFILSSGCDIPKNTPPKNIEAFVQTGRRYYWKTEPA